MKCPRCQNEDREYFYKGSKGWICRKCIQFKRQCIEEEVMEKEITEIRENANEYTLNYPLTATQKDIASMSYGYPVARCIHRCSMWCR